MLNSSENNFEKNIYDFPVDTVYAAFDTIIYMAPLLTLTRNLPRMKISHSLFYAGCGYLFMFCT